MLVAMSFMSHVTEHIVTSSKRTYLNHDSHDAGHIKIGSYLLITMKINYILIFFCHGRTGYRPTHSADADSILIMSFVFCFDFVFW